MNEEGYSYNFQRDSICAYISQPDLYDTETISFGSEFVPYMEIRFLKMEAKNATETKLVKLAVSCFRRTFTFFHFHFLTILETNVLHIERSERANSF